MIRTKICGITSYDDLRIAEDSGTDAVGFLVGQRHFSNDFITVEQAAELCRRAAPFVSTVVVTHVENTEEIVAIAESIRPSAMQLHSDFDVASMEFLAERLDFVKRIYKVSVSDDSAVDRALCLQRYADAILLDSVDLAADRVGGTGIVHDWNISRKIVRVVGCPVILAGGLTPDNISDAIEKVKPWGVDVNSGVTRNGHKDSYLANKFVANAKGFVSK